MNGRKGGRYANDCAEGVLADAEKLYGEVLLDRRKDGTTHYGVQSSQGCEGRDTCAVSLHVCDWKRTDTHGKFYLLEGEQTETSEDGEVGGERRDEVDEGLLGD